MGSVQEDWGKVSSVRLSVACPAAFSILAAMVSDFFLLPYSSKLESCVPGPPSCWSLFKKKKKNLFIHGFSELTSFLSRGHFLLRIIPDGPALFGHLEPSLRPPAGPRATPPSCLTVCSRCWLSLPPWEPKASRHLRVCLPSPLTPMGLPRGVTFETLLSPNMLSQRGSSFWTLCLPHMESTPVSCYPGQP